MERIIRFRLHVWLSSILDADYYVLALGVDMSDVLEMDGDIVLRMS